MFVSTFFFWFKNTDFFSMAWHRWQDLCIFAVNKNFLGRGSKLVYGVWQGNIKLFSPALIVQIIFEYLLL
ncbi:MAG: hypothetical protein EGR33_06785 [Prevotella sp.]|nr:hypothetical protein [Prevotella sp.]